MAQLHDDDDDGGDEWPPRVVVVMEFLEQLKPVEFERKALRSESIVVSNLVAERQTQ